MANGQWAAGQSGNPKGRPKRGQAMADALRAVLRGKGSDGRPNRRAIAEKLISMARDGDMDAIKLIFERIDGKVAESVHLGGVVEFTLMLGDGSDGE